MKQAQFEQRYRPGWQQLENQLQQLEALRVRKRDKISLDGFLDQYRQLCHQLALSTERAYSLELQQYLNDLVLRAHRQLYRYNPPLMARLGNFLAREFPRAVRRQWRWHLISFLCFSLSLAFTWTLVQQNPDMIYSMVDENGITQIEDMYLPERTAEHTRDSGDDVMMFGHYIQNNIGIAFRTFAGGLLLGIGALLVELFNGAFFGAIAAHLLNAGAGEPFFSFVITHGAPELTAIMLSGGAGLRLGWAILVPGPMSRLAALRLAARDALPVMYGVFCLLLLAAFIEAFWSPRQLDVSIKYTVGSCGWLALYLYLFLGGRRGAGE
ncbi:MAG: stage II sporulation protein M [Alcanivorax sp.]|nr:stage II sporulation protein M [Alcanivorax sp.]